MANVLNDPQFQPPKIYLEGTWLYGAIVTAILYGIVVVLYVMCARSLWGRIRPDKSASKNWFFFIYVNLLFALSTLFAVSNTQIIQLGFVNHRDYPGGPAAYELETASIPLNVSFVVSNWCANALMVWRCIVVYRDSRFHLIVAMVGCLMFLASVVTGSLWVIIVSQPADSMIGWMSFTFLFPFLGVSLAINVFICILTVIRLLYHRACISKVLGSAYGVLYTSFATMIVESAAVYSICSLLYLIPYAASSPLANASMQILGEAQVIAPLLIIYRVSEGKAWSKDMASGPAPSDPQLMRQLSVPRSPGTLQTARPLNMQVALDCAQHNDREDSIQFASGRVTLANHLLFQSNKIGTN